MKKRISILAGLGLAALLTGAVLTSCGSSDGYPVQVLLTEAEGYVWGMIRAAQASVSDTCIVPLQDYLNLGGEARMNFPGTSTDANWTWRLAQGLVTDELADRIRAMTVLYGRLPVV